MTRMVIRATDPFRSGPHKARTARTDPPRSVHFIEAVNTSPSHTYFGPRARILAHIFFLIFMIKLSMFKNWETLRSLQN